MVRDATWSDVAQIKEIIDDEPKMDADSETFTESYLERMVDEEVVLVSEAGEDIVGVCFGKYDADEGWCDFLGLVVIDGYRGEGRGTSLVQAFEASLPSGVQTIDLFATQSETEFFESLGYERGRTYVAYRKHV